MHKSSGQSSSGANGQRVLYVGNDAQHFISHRQPIALGVYAAGYQVHVAFPPHPEAQAALDANFTYHPIPLTRQGLAPLQEIKTFQQILQVYRNVRPQLVHQFTIKPVIYGSLASRWLRIPAVVSSMTGTGMLFANSDTKTRLLRFGATRAFRIALQHQNMRLIVQNPDDAAIFRDNKLVPPALIRVIRGSGVDMRAFNPQPFPSPPIVITLAARMIWQKGIGEYIEVARRFQREGIEAQFWLVGDSDEGQRGSIPRAQLEAWHDEGLVVWHGFRSDIASVYAASHIICLPSYYREGVPKSLIEAAAAGRPIVTTDSAGCREVVSHGQNGLLVPPKDVDALDAALRQLVQAPEQLPQMGQRGREIAVEQFSLAYVTEQILAVYREVLA